MPTRNAVTLNRATWQRLSRTAPTARERSALVAVALNQLWARSDRDARDSEILDQIASAEADDIEDAASFQIDPMAEAR